MTRAASRVSRVRRGLARLAAAGVLAATIVIALAGSALAGRSVPHGFFAMNWDQEIAFRSTLGCGSGRVRRDGAIARWAGRSSSKEAKA